MKKTNYYDTLVGLKSSDKHDIYPHYPVNPVRKKPSPIQHFYVDQALRF